jgi:hypothetical protein
MHVTKATVTMATSWPPTLVAMGIWKFSTLFSTLCSLPTYNFYGLAYLPNTLEKSEVLTRHAGVLTLYDDQPNKAKQGTTAVDEKRWVQTQKNKSPPPKKTDKNNKTHQNEQKNIYTNKNKYNQTKTGSGQQG